MERGDICLAVWLAVTIVGSVSHTLPVSGDKLPATVSPETADNKLTTYECSVSIKAGPVIEQLSDFNTESAVETLVSQAFQFNMQNVFNCSSFRELFVKCFVFNLSIDKDKVLLGFYLHFNKREKKAGPSTEDVSKTITDAVNEKGAIGMFVIDVNSIVIEEMQVCEKIFLPECDNSVFAPDIPYNITAYPNPLGHLSQLEATYAGINVRVPLENECHPHLHLYWCVVFTPVCGVDNKPLPPCRGFCKAVQTQCGHLLEDPSWITDCESFPDSEDPDVCFGQPPTVPPIEEEISGCLPLPEDSVCRDIGYEATLPTTDLFTIGHTLNQFGMVDKLRCHRFLKLFGCSLLLPPCEESPGGNVTLFPPCRRLCTAVKFHCGFFLDVVGGQEALDMADCDSLPDSLDPDVCIGGAEILDADRNGHLPEPELARAFRCDGDQRLIPYDWVCDGQTDCGDSTDESSCAFCNEGFRCQNFLCLNSSAVCDGVADCITAEDEDNCIKLSEWNDTKQILNKYDGLSAKWYPVCSTGFDNLTGNSVCKALSYDGMTKYRNVPLDDLPAKLWHVNNTSFTLEDRLACSSGTALQLECSSDCLQPSAAIAPLLPRLETKKGGLNMEPAMWPWLVSLHGGPDATFFCGGSLINSQYVLTAAHCLGRRTDPKDLQVFLGRTRRLSSTNSRAKIDVKKIISHPLYNHHKQNNFADVALLKLERPVENSRYIRPLCLPNTTVSDMGPAEGQPCVVAGWGKRTGSDNDYSPVSRLRQLHVVSREKCTSLLDPFIGMHVAEITDSHMCASAPGSDDACNGDSGGMLLCQDFSEEWQPTGIVSWGIICGDKDVPGVYTYLPAYKDWIEQSIADT